MQCGFKFDQLQMDKKSTIRVGPGDQSNIFYWILSVINQLLESRKSIQKRYIF